MEEHEIAQAIFKDKYAKKRTFQDMLIAAGVASIENTKPVDEWRPGLKKEAFVESRKRSKKQVDYEKPKRRQTWRGKLWSNILRLIDWLNSLVGVEHSKSKYAHQQENEVMLSIEDLFHIAANDDDLQEETQCK